MRRAVASAAATLNRLGEVAGEGAEPGESAPPGDWAHMGMGRDDCDARDGGDACSLGGAS